MNLPFEQFPALSAIEICRHAFTQRIAGVDVSHDKATALKGLDAAHHAIRNSIGVGDLPLITAQQIHGNKIAVVDSRFHRLSPFYRGEDEGEGLEDPDPLSTLAPNKGDMTQDMRGSTKDSENPDLPQKYQTEFRGCDGIITNQRGIALGIYVADCCAVYIVDPQTPAIGLVHSGRKGTELGVVTNAITEMIDRFDSDPAHMIVQLSPCIRPPHYETDFAAEIIRQCHALGVNELHDSNVCTACDLNRYYSYRAEKGKTGRMLALLALTPPMPD